jgi:ATP-dependent helicase/nuclease subunit A
MSATPGVSPFPATGDQYARELAESPAQSFLVEAPAGSGKTALLTRRFLRLLTVVERPEAVVALTFTRKAAGEMRDRVLTALRNAQASFEPVEEYERELICLASGVLVRDKELNWRLLENPNLLQIQTIDSLCATLTREMPLQAALGGVPRVKEHAEELYRLAARRALTKMATGALEMKNVFRSVLAHFESDLRKLEKQIADMLARREQWLDLFGRNEITRDLVEQSLRDQAESVLRDAWSLWPENIPDRLSPNLEQLERWKRFGDHHLLKGKKEAKRGSSHASALDSNPRFAEALHHTRAEIPLTVDDEQWELIHNFAVMLVVAAGELRAQFQDYGEVDFTEITQAAILALGTPEIPTDLLYRLDYRIEHLLIDEFQDTSVSQYRLVEALTCEWSAGDNKSLFVVGDPMQSIYGFRQAEVSLFLDAAEGRLGHVALERLQLTANFRSTRAITEWVNSRMSAVMTADDRDNGAVCFRPAEAQRVEPDGGAGSEPLFQPFFGSDADEAEAEWIARVARQKLEEGQKVAVLVRARSHVVEILRAFRRAEGGAVPYEAIEIDPLEEQQHVLDVLSIARAILHVGDRVSWLACLRAPWCGLSLADLSALAEGSPAQTILELLEDVDRIATLSQDGRLRAARCGEILRSAVGCAGRRPIRGLVEAAWLELGGPATLTGAEQHEDVEALLELLDEFDDGGMIRDFSLIDDRLEFLFARAQTGGNRVQVMTVHGAKGLEFDTVFLPQLHRSGAPTENPLLAWTERRQADGQSRVLLAGSPRKGESDALYKLVTDCARRKEKHEEARLFYVALTRAKNELYLSACLAEKDDGSTYSQPNYQSPLRRYIWSWAQPLIGPAWTQHIQSREPQMALFDTLFDKPRSPSLLRRLPAEWRAPTPAPAIDVALDPERRIASAPRVTYEWVEDVTRHVGTIVHDYLRRFAEDGLAGWSDLRIEDERASIESELRRMGTATANLGKAAGGVMQALYNVIASEHARWLLAAHAEAYNEWPVSGFLNGQLMNATIDRTFVDSSGILWIIDFKTSSHEGGRLEAFLDEEERRYRPQLENYAALLRMKETREIRLGLYFPLLDEWRFWVWQESAAGAEG